MGVGSAQKIKVCYDTVTGDEVEVKKKGPFRKPKCPEGSSETPPVKQDEVIIDDPTSRMFDWVMSETFRSSLGYGDRIHNPDTIGDTYTAWDDNGRLAIERHQYGMAEFQRIWAELMEGETPPPILEQSEPSPPHFFDIQYDSPTKSYLGPEGFGLGFLTPNGSLYDPYVREKVENFENRLDVYTDIFIINKYEELLVLQNNNATNPEEYPLTSETKAELDRVIGEHKELYDSLKDAILGDSEAEE